MTSLGNFDTPGTHRGRDAEEAVPRHLSPRYLRQREFPALGAEGQRRLSRARVAVVGAGALGTHVLDLLARAGVGFIRVIDGDVVEEHNLPRTTLFDLADARRFRPKAEAVRAHLARIDPDVRVDAHVAELYPENAEAFLADVDLIVDGTDRPEVRYLLDDASRKFQIPWVHGAVRRSSGTVVAFDPAAGMCYRRLFPHPPKEARNSGVIGPAPTVVGALQAAIALRILSGQRAEAVGRLLHIDTWTLAVTSFEMPALRPSASGPEDPCRNPEFPALEASTPDVLVRSSPGSGHPEVVLHPLGGKPVELGEAAGRLAPYGEVTLTPSVLRAEFPRPLRGDASSPLPSPRTLLLFPDGRCVIAGTDDVEEALFVSRLAFGT